MTVEALTIGSEVLVYGAGGFGRWLADLATAHGLVVRALIDRAPSTENGAVSVAEAANCFPDRTVLLGVFSPEPDIHAIDASLRESGLETIVSPPQFFSWLGARAAQASRYWLTTNDSIYRDEASTIDRARSLLVDDESVALFDSLISYRASGRLAASPRPRPLVEQHAGPDFAFLPTEAGLVVDCGAFTGDTFPNWAGLAHSVVLALEPHPDSYADLVGAADRTALNVVPLPFGVFDAPGQLAIEGSGSSARLVATSSGTVAVVTLDTVCAGARTTFIKMDIEGAEPAALRGARRTLARDRPHLSISVYHEPAHLWSIATWLHDEIDGYDFRLRVYAQQGFDTVLYATPR